MDDVGSAGLRAVIRPALGGIIGAAFTLLLFGAAGFFWPRSVAPTMSYAELVSILLTGVGVLVTTLGVFVAILAVWGYATFRNVAKTTARSHVTHEIKHGDIKVAIATAIDEHLKRELGEDGNLRALLERRADAIIYGRGMGKSAEADKTEGKIELPDDDSESNPD